MMDDPLKMYVCVLMCVIKVSIPNTKFLSIFTDTFNIISLMVMGPIDFLSFKK